MYATQNRTAIDEYHDAMNGQNSSAVPAVSWWKVGQVSFMGEVVVVVVVFCGCGGGDNESEVIGCYSGGGGCDGDGGRCGGGLGDGGGGEIIIP